MAPKQRSKAHKALAAVAGSRALRQIPFVEAQEEGLAAARKKRHDRFSPHLKESCPMSSDDLIEGLQLDPTRLPEEIRDLAPFIREWAVGDDIQRSARLENASDDDLRALVEAVAPHWELVNSWLDETNEQEPVPDEAVLVSWLAEAAAEAETMIE